MTLFLASVRDVAEAETALLAGADIVDLKDPAQGALGAVDPATARSVVDVVAGRVPVSATIGDLPMRAEAIRGAVLERAACGVDYVKFGLFPGGDPQALLRSASSHFSPHAPHPRAVRRRTARPSMPWPRRRTWELPGIMLDTADKGCRLASRPSRPSAARKFRDPRQGTWPDGGLAGSLAAADVPELLPLRRTCSAFAARFVRGPAAPRSILPPAPSIRALIPRTGAPAETKPSATMTEAAAQALC